MMNRLESARFSWHSGRAASVITASAIVLLAANSHHSVALAAETSCQDYFHVGERNNKPANYVSATLREVRQPNVFDGHVAGWVGISDESQTTWLQAGIERSVNEETGQVEPISHLYVESKRRNKEPIYQSLGTIATGTSKRIEIKEVAKDKWTLLINGHKKLASYLLPSSHGNLLPSFIGEVWIGPTETCGRFSTYQYQFEDIKVNEPKDGEPHAPQLPIAYDSDGPYRLLFLESGFIAQSTRQR